MFSNVLIVEDHRSVKHAIEQTLKELGINDPQFAYYCDDALTRLKNAIKENSPFELLITDLSFDGDGRKQTIAEGKDLIRVAKQLQPDLKVLVFSGEPNPAVAGQLFQQYHIDGYVRKGRQDTLELKEAIESLYKDKKYISPEFQQAIRAKNAHDFSTYDIIIISQLAKGTLQKNLPAYLQQQNITPSSLSSIEKRLNQIKEAFRFTNNEQLIAHCKDRKLI
jgi:two-component system, NarL family, captular synthesis response regulator RcsB